MTLHDLHPTRWYTQAGNIGKHEPTYHTTDSILPKEKYKTITGIMGFSPRCMCILILCINVCTLDCRDGLINKIYRETSVYREKKHPYDCFTNLSIPMTAFSLA